MFNNPTVLKYMVFILMGIVLVLSIAVIYLAFKKNEYYVVDEKPTKQPEPVMTEEKVEEPTVLPIELDVQDDEEQPVSVMEINPVKEPEVRGLRLTVRFGAQSRSHDLVQFPCEIGRDPSSTFVLNDSAVSRKHCRILLEEESFFLEDIAEHNGTFLNGIKVPQNSKTRLGVGDEISLGHVQLILQEVIKA